MTGDKTIIASKQFVEDELSKFSVSPVAKPAITAPADGTTDFIGEVTTDAYSTTDSYEGAQDFVRWKATNSDGSVVYDSYEGSSNLASWTPSIGLATTDVYVSVQKGSDGHLSEWSDAVMFTTPNIYVETPTVSTTGAPSDVPETPTISTGAFSVYNGSDTHESTDWQIIRDSDSTVVWESLADTSNLESITVPGGVLDTGESYTFKARHIGATYGSSPYASVSATTMANFVPAQGQKNFSVEPTSDAFGLIGLNELTGTNDPASDEYGNYQHDNGSIVCHMKRKWYRIGHPNSPRYAEYGDNAIDIEPASAYPDEATANADGFVLHRAFIDGGAIKDGFFIDKYKASKHGTSDEALSAKDGVPLSLTDITSYTNTDGLTGCTGILADAVVLSRARGTGWNTTSAFMRGWIAIVSVAQAQAASSTTDCAWYDDTGAANYPKGCNDSLGDVDDAEVTYTTAGDSGSADKPLTGSGTLFAKTTHNGSNNGVADVNGGMYEVDLGITNAGTSDTDSSAISDDSLYILKQSIALADLTSGFNGTNDAWGDSSNLSNKYDLVTCNIPIGTSTGSVYWGSGTNQVIDGSTSGQGRDLAGILPKDTASTDATGTNLYGTDQLYKYNIANMFMRSCGYWSDSAGAGVFYRYLLNSYRSNDNYLYGFRAAAYVAS